MSENSGEKRDVLVRRNNEILPSFNAFVDEIDKNGITPELLYKIIQRHRPNSLYNKNLWDRYRATADGVPIFKRAARYEDDTDPINNKVNNDFFGEIVDFKVGYFAGKPISYSYSNTETSKEEIGGEEAFEKASKAVSDFVTRNNMFGVDMETTRYASIYGYAGRLFYIDLEGNERVMPVHGYETIILSKTDISEPKYAIRYYEVTDINDVESWVVEFYDNEKFYTYKGMLSHLELDGEQEHGFDYCPLQGVANNKECMGDAEKVLSLIDEYDKAISDNANEMEAFASAYMIFEGLRVDDDTIKKGKKSGSFILPAAGTQNGKMYYLTKNINDTFTENNLQHFEDNIYRFSKTPNMNKDIFSSASGKALKFRIHQLETKCGSFQANVMNSMVYMWKVLASSWAKREITIDPLHCTAEFARNFPMDTLENAQAAQALISAGVPKRVAWNICIPEIDDIDEVLEILEEEQDDIENLYPSKKDKDDKGKTENKQQEQ